MSSTVFAALLNGLRENGLDDPYIVRTGEFVKENYPDERNQPAPDELNRQMYGNLPQDRIVLLEGKLADAAFDMVVADRKITYFDIISDVHLRNAARLADRDFREGKIDDWFVPATIWNSDMTDCLTESLALLQKRIGYNQKQLFSQYTRPKRTVKPLVIDSSRWSRPEIEGLFLPERFTPEIEFDIMKCEISDLENLSERVLGKEFVESKIIGRRPNDLQEKKEEARSFMIKTLRAILRAAPDINPKISRDFSSHNETGVDPDSGKILPTGLAAVLTDNWPADFKPRGLADVFCE